MTIKYRDGWICRGSPWTWAKLRVARNSSRVVRLESSGLDHLVYIQNHVTLKILCRSSRPHNKIRTKTLVGSMFLACRSTLAASSLARRQSLVQWPPTCVSSCFVLTLLSPFSYRRYEALIGSITHVINLKHLHQNFIASRLQPKISISNYKSFIKLKINAEAMVRLST